jgi:A/G-specific adenine glycosylase
VQHPINSTEGKKQLQTIADQIIDPVHPGIHNQAMMELGATICLPRQPKCEVCPVQTVCMAHHHHSIANFPSKIAKTKVRDRFFNYFHIMHENETFLRKRIEDDVWKNLYEFPLIETSGQVSLIEISDEEKFRKWFSKSHSVQFEHVVSMKHILSHQRIFAEFYRVKTEKSMDHLPELSFIKIDRVDIEKYPVSRLIHKYLERFFVE